MIISLLEGAVVFLSVGLLCFLIGFLMTATKEEIKGKITSLIEKINGLLKKYCTKENISDYFFLIVAAFVLIFFFFDACEREHYGFWGIGFEWDDFKKCLWPCFALILLHYVSKIAKSLCEKANKNK